MPGVQIPHCAAPRRGTRAGAGGAAASPSARPSTVLDHPGRRAGRSGTRQAQTGSPSSRTVHAPQSPASQPTFVPVSPRSSRRTSVRRRIGSPRTDTGFAVDPEGRLGRTAVIATQLRERASDEDERGLASIVGRCRAHRRSGSGAARSAGSTVDARALGERPPDEARLEAGQSPGDRRARTDHEPRVVDPAVRRRSRRPPRPSRSRSRGRPATRA